MKGLFRLAYCTNRYALLLPLIVYVMHISSDKLFFVKDIICTVDGGSMAFKRELHDYVKPISGYTAFWILKKIVTQFPCIDDITVRRTVDQRLYCDVRLKSIIYSVNNTHVITADGSLYLHDYFDPLFINASKNYTISSDLLDTDLNKVISFLNTVEHDLANAYEIFVKNEYEVFFYPYGTDEYYLKATIDAPLHMPVVTAAIKELPVLKKNYPTAFKKNQIIEVDMRFKDQIVFTKKQKKE